MEVALLDIREKGDNKEYNGGFGTTFQIGNSSIRSRILRFIRTESEHLPTMSYAYAAAIFKQNGHKVRYYANEIPKSFDLLLIHVSAIRCNEEIGIIKELKRMGRKNVGVYGPLATVKPELFENADFIIDGEPEAAFLEISKSGVPPQGRVASDPIMELDTLPFPDWSVFPSDDHWYSQILPLRPFAFVLASRGCPYKCSYCPYLVFGTYRARSPEKVVEELRYLKEVQGVRGFFFRDPTFTLKNERIEKIADLMIENKLDMKWGCETKLDLLSKPLLIRLHASGLRTIKVGIESLDHDQLRRYKRVPPAVLHQEEIVEFCKKIGIKVIAFYIVGLPTDSKESIEQMIKYSRKLNTSFANFTICTPIPGTDFYDELVDKIDDFNLNHYDNFHVVYKHEKLTKEEIKRYQQKAIDGYYFRPRYLMRYLIDKVRVGL